MTRPLVLDQLRALIAHARDQHMHEAADYLTESHATRRRTDRAGGGAVSSFGFDRAQADYDAATPEYLDDEDELGQDNDWCERCGDQAVCPDCVGT